MEAILTCDCEIYVSCDLLKKSIIVSPLILKMMEQTLIDTNNVILNFKLKSIL